MITVLLVCLTRHCHILQIGNDSFHSKSNSAQPQEKKEEAQTLTKS